MSELQPSRLGRTEFQRLAELRVKEAEVLLRAQCYSGAFYLAGYAIECALKASIAKRFREFDFPDKAFVQQIYDHDVEKLLKLSELGTEFNRQHEKNRELRINWAIVKGWSEAKRYELTISAKEANDLLEAVSDPKVGILQWIQQRW